MDPRSLRLLLELSRLGTVRAVAEASGMSTSTVSQQIAVLSREAGTALIEPAGRRVRLTPAGRRLADHAVTILAALDAARVDLDPGATPSGSLRIAAFASAVRQSLMPVVRTLADSHPDVRLRIHEHEPSEALALLASDDVLAVFDRFRDYDWIVNSRNTADEDVVRTVASLAGFQPRITHRADSLELVQDMIVAGLGIGLLPAARPTIKGVRLLLLRDPDITLRAYAVARRGRTDWSPLALVLG